MGASLVLPVTRVMRRGADVGRRAVSSAFGVSFSTSSARPIDEDSNSNEVEDYIWMEADQTLQCPCRFTQNFFVKRLGRHVEFDGTRDGFQSKYHDLLLPFSETEKQDIHAELERGTCRAFPKSRHTVEARLRATVCSGHMAQKTDTFPSQSQSCVVAETTTRTRSRGRRLLRRTTHRDTPTSTR